MTLSLRSFPLACLLAVAACSSALALESHPGHDRANPPPSGYWYSNVPGGYNPWTDDIRMTLLRFPASNDGVTRSRDIQIEPEGYDMHWYGRVDGAQPPGAWRFTDLGTLNPLLTGTNWVHGPGYEYPADTWVLEFTDEGSFDTWRLDNPYQFDVSEYRGIAIEVSNLGDTYLVLESDMNKWLGKGHHAVIGLEPGETDILYHPFRRDRDELPPETVDYFGGPHQLIGYPGGHLYEAVYSDIRGAEGPWKITAKVPKGVEKCNVRWSLNLMWAGGRYDVPTPEEYNAPDYEPWIDQWNQWRHDDWVGKLWTDQDCIDQYETLAQYIAENPGPAEWNDYGGWEAGPQLEATGWFRVQKYEDKWWFVDPNGRLFLSQGSLHMGANMPGPAAVAGYTQERFTDEVYFPRLRSSGLNTCGGNSSWKWHEGKLPYTYQIKTSWAPITESDFLAGGDEEFRTHVRNLVFSARRYAADPYCIGFVIDNELSISGGSTLSQQEVAEIYFSACRAALDELSADVGRPPMIMFDPASNGGEAMARHCDVLSMHRMDGYHPATHKDKFKALQAWGIDRPVGQFTFSMGNLDQGRAHYGLTMYLNQRNRAQGMANYMRNAYAHRNNIACHIYHYGDWDDRPMTEFRAVVSGTDTTDYWLADYLREVGDDMYRIHMGSADPVAGSTAPSIRVRRAGSGGLTVAPLPGASPLAPDVLVGDLSALLAARAVGGACTTTLGTPDGLLVDAADSAGSVFLLAETEHCGGRTGFRPDSFGAARATEACP